MKNSDISGVTQNEITRVLGASTRFKGDKTKYMKLQENENLKIIKDENNNNK